MGEFDELNAALEDLGTALEELSIVADKMAQAAAQSFSAILHTDMTAKDRQRLFYGFESNNWMKLHGKPMRRWKYLGRE